MHVPVYGGEKYIDECIDSVLNQTYHNIECIQYDVLRAPCNYVTENLVFDDIIDRQERGTLIRKERCMNELYGKYGTSFCVSWRKLFHRTLFDTIGFPIGKTHEDV